MTGARSGDGQPPLVGRELESIRLLHALDLVLRERSPAVVTLSAPVGMGKSRLVEEAVTLARASAFEGRIFPVAALPGDENNASIARLLRARFGLTLGANPALARAALLEQATRVVGDARAADVCFFFGRLLGIGFDGVPLSKALACDASHTELTLASALCDFFAADARQAPLYLVVEDLHFADAGSLALLEKLLEQMNGAALTIGSARPEFFARHERFSRLTSVRHEHLELHPLERSDIRALMKHTIGPGAAEHLGLEDYLAEAVQGNPGSLLQLIRELWAVGALETDVGGKRLLFRPERLPALDDMALLLSRQLAGSGSSYLAALNRLSAAELAMREGAGADAATHFRPGVAELGDEDHRRRIDALHAYGASLADLGRPTPARAAFTAMLKLAEQRALPGKQGAALNRLGRLHRESGELRLARGYFERARAAFELAGDQRGISAAEDDLGKVLWLEGDSAAALALLRAGLEGRKRLGDRRSVAVSLAHLAPVWDERGKAGIAEEALGIAHELFSSEHDVGGCCDTQLALGRLATHRHDLPRAELHFRSALELSAATADRPRMAMSLVQLGETRLRVNDLLGAEPLLEQACSIAESIEAWLGLAEAKRGLAKLQLKRHRLADARKSIRASLHLARRAHSRLQLVATLRTLAEVAAAGAWGPSAEGRAVGYYMRSIELAKEIENELELAKGYRSFARYAERYERPEIVEQSSLLRRLSDEIFERHEGRA